MIIPSSWWKKNRSLSHFWELNGPLMNPIHPKDNMCQWWSKDALCKVLLKLAQCFCKCCRCIFAIFFFFSCGKIWTNLNPFYLRMLCAEFLEIEHVVVKLKILKYIYIFKLYRHFLPRPSPGGGTVKLQWDLSKSSKM